MIGRSETFGRLLKGAINSIATYERRTAPVVEEELAAKVGLAGSAIQRYKAGHLPPDPRTVEVLAEAAVRRAYLNRLWLQQFLAAARYPNAAALLDRLCPTSLERPRPPRVAHNLPAPTYSQFVMREEAFAEVMDGLGKRSAAVIVVGLGGTGKTSLAHEAAVQCLARAGRYPSFDAAVWVSDKDRPGATNLSGVLDEIARTLDYPGFTQFAHDEKRRAVEQLLRGQRVLVCVDNFETIADTGLLAWLLNLPEPSKALITTREDRREFRRGGWPVELRGMTEAEARAFVVERLRVLRLDRLVSDAAQLAPLVEATAGNPKAIELMLGLLKYQRQPLQELIGQLYAARGEIFDDLFARTWSLLDLPAQQVLLALTFFPAGASDAALRASADVHNFTFDHARERLIDLSLLDVQQADLERPPRYALHPLVRAFASAKLAERSAFAEEARRRWVGWYVALAGQVGHCWNAPERLDLLEPEQESVLAAIQWAAQHGLRQETAALAHGVGYFYHVRGHWGKRIEVNRLRAAAARAMGDRALEAQSLANCVLTPTAQGNLDDAQPLAAQLAEMPASTPFAGDVLCRVQRALAHVQIGVCSGSIVIGWRLPRFPRSARRWRSGSEE